MFTLLGNTQCGESFSALTQHGADLTWTAPAMIRAEELCAAPGERDAIDLDCIRTGVERLGDIFRTHTLNVSQY